MTTTPTPPAGVPKYSPGDDKRLGHADALRELARVRREVQRWQQQVTEAERRAAELVPADEVESKLAEVRADHERQRRDLMAENVARQHGLPDELAGRLMGNSRDELEADARALFRRITREG